MGEHQSASFPWNEIELRDVVALEVLPNYRLHLQFDDDKQGIVDIRWLTEDFWGLFSPLRDTEYFAKAFVHPEACVVTWPNGADIDSDVLYSFATDAPIKLYPAGHKDFVSVEDQLKALSTTPA